MVILVILIGAGVTAIAWWAILASHECPREILGYNCKGAGLCDHSNLEVARAKQAMNKGRNHL